MESRLNPYEVQPELMKAMLALEARVANAGLESSLMDLVKTRASQINGCVFCIDMHTHDARAKGETESRLFLLNAWREAPVYSDRERAALEWTEAVTRVSETHAPDAAYDCVRLHFDEVELVCLTLLISTINAWNRIAISFRSQPQLRRVGASG